MSRRFLVQITFKGWLHVAPEHGTDLSLEEVEAADEYYARHTAWKQFISGKLRTAEMSERLLKMGLTPADLCCGQAVELT